MFGLIYNMFSFKKQQKESRKMLYIATYYPVSDEDTITWDLFVANPEVDLKKELIKFLKNCFDLKIAKKDIIDIIPVIKEQDVNGGNYDIKLYGTSKR